MRPLLSVVVPTKNRFYYLEFLVVYFHSIDYNNVELVIQDNSDLEVSIQIKALLESIADDRIKYFCSKLELSQTGNCQEATYNAIGEYITMIGDDDIFSKYLIDYVQICKDRSVDAILPNKGSYTWPDVQPRFYKNKLSGIFKLTNFTGSSHKIDVNSELNKVIRLGGTQILNMPRVYHGVVKRSVLNVLMQESGSFYPGPSPDIANAVALCKYRINVVSIDIPLIISGQSISSAGGQGALGLHFGDISKIKQLPVDTASNWSSKVPFYWSGYTIYAESVIQSLKRMKMDNLLNMINFEYLYATCLIFDIDYRDRVLKVLKQPSESWLNISLFKIAYFFCIIWLKRILFHVRNNLVLVLPKFLKQKDTITQMSNILDVALFNDKLISQKINFEKFDIK